jgi:hypothetical protein
VSPRKSRADAAPALLLRVRQAAPLPAEDGGAPTAAAAAAGSGAGEAWLTLKLKINPTPDPSKLFWRIWHSFGIWGLGLIAPVTIGPQASAALCLALGEPPRRIQLAISLGVAPWAIVIGILTAAGLSVLK